MHLWPRIENKSKACSNASYQCSAMRVDGFKYCIQHILQDKAAPYTQCAYTFPLSFSSCYYWKGCFVVYL